MWEEVLKLAASNGLWAVLSCVLLSYLVRDSRKREQKYTETIGALMEKLRVVTSVKEDTQQILEVLRSIDFTPQATVPRKRKPVKSLREKSEGIVS